MRSARRGAESVPAIATKPGGRTPFAWGTCTTVETFRSRLNDIVGQKNTLLKALSPAYQPLDAAKIAEEYLGYAQTLKIHVTDTTSFLHKALAAGKRLLFEGAQGSLLDLDHGTFPFVTSSSSSGCGIHSGSGVPERNISRVIGVVKAYKANRVEEIRFPPSSITKSAGTFAT